ncbi:MAG: hypothetical protein H6953_05870 [Chromatiaceae bacterium]|nr:hypothetical protein [Chromatiaceae bacterium]MCP5314911.1 hypothetical protein [Chromatiaceae bacterium]
MNKILILGAAIALAGCSTLGNKTSTGVAGETHAIAVDECIFYKDERRESGLLTALVGGVIKGALTRVGSALKAAGEEDSDSVVGRLVGEFEPGQPPKCLVLAKGEWTSDENKAWSVPQGGRTAPRTVKLAREDNPKDGFFLSNPDFVLELVVRPSGDKSSLRLIPSFFEYRRMIEDKMPGTGSVTRGIVVKTVAFAPGQSADGESAVGGALVLGDMETGYRYYPIAGERSPIDSPGERSSFGFMERTTPWFGTFTPVAQEATNKQQAATPGPSRTQPVAKQYLPRTISVTLTETRKARKVLLFLAEVFQGAEEDLKAYAEQKLLDSKRAEAELEASKASTELMSTYINDLAAAEVKIREYCAAEKTSSTDLLNKSSAANVAQRKANLAALAASQSQPYTSFVELGTADPSSSGFCQ